jgi:hypothetical protein
MPADTAIAARVACSWRLAAERVLARCDRLEVFRIHAAAVAAQVIEFQPVRDWPDEVLVRDAMRLEAALLALRAS